MKRWLLIIGLVMANFCVWAQEEEMANYNISGTVPAGVKVVFLNSLHSEPIDTAFVDNGRFQMEGVLPMHTFVTVVDDGTDLPVNVLIDGIRLEINMERSTVKGSKINERLNKVDRQITNLSIDYMQDQMEYAQVKPWQTEERDSLRRVMAATYNKLVVEMKNVMRDNPDNVIPALYLSQIYNTLKKDGILLLRGVDKLDCWSLKLLFDKGQAYRDEKPISLIDYENIMEAGFRHVELVPIHIREYYKTKEDLMALLIKTPILTDFSEINENNMINETTEIDNEKLDKYILENNTDKGILLIRRYYGITAIK